MKASTRSTPSSSDIVHLDTDMMVEPNITSNIKSKFSKENDDPAIPVSEDATTELDDSEVPSQQVLADDERKTLRSNRMKKIFIGVLLVAFVTFLIVDSLTNGYVRDGIVDFLAWIEENPVPGFFIFMIVYFLATVLLVPASILTLGSGFVFANAFGLGIGILLGTLAVVFGACTGAIVSFLLGRYLLRDWVKGLTKKYAIFEALDAALEEKGFRIMVLIRLSPIIPFNIINYMAGVTSVSFRDYVTSMIGILPGTGLYVFLGASAGSLTDSMSSGSSNMALTISIIVVGCVLGIAAIALTSFYAKKELNRVLSEREAAAASPGEPVYDIEAQNPEGVDNVETQHPEEISA